MSPGRHSTQSPGAPRRSVLLVEDDPANWLTLSAVLEDAGFEVAVAESCAQATRLLEAQPRYDVVLLDSILGDGSGWALIPLIRQRVPQARLVLVTGQTASTVGARVEAVFHKGEPVQQLLECLDRLLT
jgi:two-component system response regulator RegA